MTGSDYHVGYYCQAKVRGYILFHVSLLPRHCSDWHVSQTSCRGQDCSAPSVVSAVYGTNRFSAVVGYISLVDFVRVVEGSLI